jgi:hypothetical protein
LGTTTGKYIICPSCKTETELKITKNDRPTFLCLNCGLHCFSRLDKSQQWFVNLVNKRG